MIIFIDTNIFFDHWFLDTPLFRLLANYANNEKFTLLVSEVVCEEINNKFEKGLESATKKLESAYCLASNFRKNLLPPPISALSDRYEFRAILQDKFNNIRFVPFDKVSNLLLVSRAIESVRPFRENEKGYRDTLIWLSLLDFIREHYDNDGTIVFISSNERDFMERGAENNVLHADLKEDLQRQKFRGNFHLFTSLKEFSNANIDKSKHSVDRRHFEGNHGGDLEFFAGAAAIQYLQQMALPRVQALLEDAMVPSGCARAIRTFSAEDFEGVEDPEVRSISDVSDGTLYVQYYFNLLTVMFSFEVLTEDYLANPTEFEAEFINIEIQGYKTTMQTFRRVDFDASMTLESSSKKLIAISIDRATVRSLQRGRRR